MKVDYIHTDGRGNTVTEGESDRWHSYNDDRIKVALEIALTVLEQIATTPRNRGAKRTAAATVAFLRTQLDAHDNKKEEWND